jgi:hypothetical protein
MLKHLLIFIFAFSLATSADAAPIARKTKFNQTAQNMAEENGLATGEPLTSYCNFTVINRSAVSQNYTIIGSIISYGPTNPTLKVESAINFSGTIAAGGDPVYHQQAYPAFPADVAGKQNLICTGEVTATDVSDTPGSILVSGTIDSFTQAGQAETESTPTMRGIAVFTQVPILINRGDPI